MVAPKVSITWAPGQRLTASAGTGPSHDISAPTLAEPWVSLFFQGVVQLGKPTESISKDSSVYRALLLDCRSKLEACGDIDGANSVAHQHVVWRFIEVVYLGQRDQHLSLRLEQWYYDAYPALFLRAEHLLNGLENARAIDEEQFWDAVAGLAAVGARGKAFQLVSARNSVSADEWADATGAAALGLGDQHTGAGGGTVTPLAVACSLFEECPQEVVAARRDGRWEQWQNNCAQWARSEELAQHEGVRTLLGVLAGDLIVCAQVCRDWVQLLVASACYARNNDVYGSIELACGEASAHFEPPAIAAGALTEAALGAPARAVARLAACAPTPWVAAHLSDLLVRAKVLPSDTSAHEGKMSVRAFYFHALAVALERHRGLWRVAARYYQECPNIKDEATKALILRAPIDDHADPVYDKLLRFCELHRWNDTASALCERVGSQCLEHRQFAAALLAFSRGGLPLRARETADAALVAAEAAGPASVAAHDLACLVRALASCDDPALGATLEYTRLYSVFQSRVAAWRDYENARDEAIEAALDLLGCGGLDRRHWLAAVVDVAFLCCSKFDPPSGDAAHRLLATLQLVSGKYRASDATAGLHRRAQLEIDGDPSLLVEKKIMEARTILVDAVARASLVP